MLNLCSRMCQDTGRHRSAQRLAGLIVDRRWHARHDGRPAGRRARFARAQRSRRRTERRASDGRPPVCASATTARQPRRDAPPHRPASRAARTVAGPRLFVPSAAQHEMTRDGYRLLAKSRAVRRSIARAARCDVAADMCQGAARAVSGHKYRHSRQSCHRERHLTRSWQVTIGKKTLHCTLQVYCQTYANCFIAFVGACGSRCRVRRRRSSATLERHVHHNANEQRPASR